MSTLLLILCLGLNANTSCPGRVKSLPPVASQDQGTLLNPLLAEVESCEEPALRVFLRLRMATHFWNSPARSVKPESVAVAALADLRAHEKEIPSLYLDQFRRNLVAQLQVHAPEAAASLAAENGMDRRTDVEVAYAMLSKERGADQAVGIVQRSIAGGKDPGPIIVSFLHRLEPLRPAAVSTLLQVVVAEEEASPGVISTHTLFGLKHLVIRKQTDPEIQRRYLVTVVKRAGEKDLRQGSVVDIYGILADVLPQLEKQAPELYYPATAALLQLTERMPIRTLERISIDKRVRESADPLAQLIVEGEAVKDLSLRDDLQIEAAQLALEKGQIQVAVSMVLKLQPRDDEALLWRDQFIEGAVSEAVKKGELGVAEQGAARIHAASIRSSALQKIALHFQMSKETSRARNSLISAQRSIQTLDDSPDKAVALLDLANAFIKVDHQRALDLARAAVKIINSYPSITEKVDAGTDRQLANVEKMLKIAFNLIPNFQALGAMDELEALNLAKDIKRQELRIAATFGAYTRPAVARNAPTVASK